MKIVKWSTLVDEFIQANKNDEALYGLVVFNPVKSAWRTHCDYLTEKGNFTKRAVKYKYEDCCYTFSSMNKYFDTTKFGNSLYASCLTGEDANGVNIGNIGINWKRGWWVDVCVIFDSLDEMRAFREHPRKGLAYKEYKKIK